MSTVQSFPEYHRQSMRPYLPPSTLPSPPTGETSSSELYPEITFPHVTLTYASSLDSGIALRPGMQTALSGPDSKSMTHYLRAKHDAILIGHGTAQADNPSLGCRLPGVNDLQFQPRPVILDLYSRWRFTENTAIIRRAMEDLGMAPWIFRLGEPGVEKDWPQSEVELIRRCGGDIIEFPFGSVGDAGRLNWETILKALADRRIRSVMIEGGAGVINDLLIPAHHEFINSVILTLAPVWLGSGCVAVAPPQERRNSDQPVASEASEAFPIGRLEEVKWIPMGQDVVLCGVLP